MTRMTTCSAATSMLTLALLAINAPSSALVPDNPTGAYMGDFAIHAKSVIPDTRYIARFRVLGAEITANGAYDMPVTASIQIGSSTSEPFGPLSNPATGNVNDHEFPKDFILDQHVPANTPFTIEAKSWKRDGDYTNGSTPGQFENFITVSSSEQSANLIVLRNGDSVPPIPAFQNQTQIGDIIRDHINPVTGKVVIADDEAIFLFELGTTNLNSAAADFQDFVILVTLADDKSHFDGPRVPPGLQFD